MKLSYTKRKVLEEELAKLYQEHGSIAPKLLVKLASDPGHPLHEGFGWVWDDAKAAAKQREGHARKLIASVKVEVIHERQVLAVPVYVHDPKADPGEGYTKLSAIKSERDRARSLLKTEISRALRYIERARGIAVELDLDEEFKQRLETAGVYLEEVAKLVSVA